MDFAWTEIERGLRSVESGGKRIRRTFVRARCACGAERLMPAHDFDSRKTSRCNACRLRQASASGWAHARVRRGKNSQTRSGGNG